MSEYITDAEIDEMVRRLEALVAVDIRTALRDAVLWGARYAEVRQQSKSGGDFDAWWKSRGPALAPLGAKFCARRAWLEKPESTGAEVHKPDSYDRFADEMQDEFERRMAE